MKVLLRIIFSIIAIAIVAEGCICAYEYFTTEYLIGEETITIEEPLFTLENYPKVDASEETKKLADAFVKEFTEEENVDTSYTNQGYIRLIDREVDLIIAPEPSEEILKYAQDNNIELETIPVIKEGLIFCTNIENKTEDLSLENLQDIYTGKITNWKDLNGENIKIKALQTTENQAEILSTVIKNKKLVVSAKENVVESMEETINQISQGKSDIIGYLRYEYLEKVLKNENKDALEKIKVLSIDGIEVTDETIKDGKYPLETVYYIVIRKDELKDSNARKLADAMVSSRGQRIAEETGYIRMK